MLWRAFPQLAEVLYTQTHTNIFFLDWEKERNPPVTLVDTEAGMEGGFEGAGAGGREGHRPAHLKKRATRCGGGAVSVSALHCVTCDCCGTQVPNGVCLANHPGSQRVV